MCATSRSCEINQSRWTGQVTEFMRKFIPYDAMEYIAKE